MPMRLRMQKNGGFVSRRFYIHCKYLVATNSRKKYRSQRSELSLEAKIPAASQSIVKRRVSGALS